MDVIDELEASRVAPPLPTAGEWDSMLERALGGFGVEVHFQPIVNISQRSIVGYESLARFDHPSKSTPDRWFAEARARGITADLEMTVLRTTLRHRADLPPGCFLSLNMEPDALMDQRVSLLLANQESLEGLVIEFTEHIDAGAISGLANAIEDLRRAGAKIAVDDAGAGYSGLKRIIELNPDYLKIDRSLVMDLDRNDANAAIVEMLGGFAARIDAWVIAEGVERPAELDQLRRLRIPLVQGYLLGRPLPGYQGLGASGQGVLASSLVVDDQTVSIRSILETAAWVTEAEVEDAHKILANRLDLDVVVVVGPNRRPVGCVDRQTPTGSLRPVWRAWAGTPVRDLARQIVARPTNDRYALTVCCDAAGCLLGIVRLERLLFELSA